MFHSAYKYTPIVLSVLLVALLFVPLVASAQQDPNAGTSAAGALATGAKWVYEYLGIQWLLQVVFTGIGTLLLTATGVLVAIAGAIFDALIQWTVVDLSGTLVRLGIAEGTNLVWAAFRDLANILIIGMFVFIAISIILGTTRFGDKSMIARVLIVAVLINFSLLFTRIIIEGSNLVARVFYQESLSAIGNTSGTGTNLTTNQGVQAANQNTVGIAGAFMGRAGIPSFWKTGSIISQLWQTGRANNSAFIIIVFALASSTFLIIASLVFLYGSFLMVSRAILLVFLTITSSLAFASYLIPQFSDTQYGWRGWWDTLIKAALFGPFLMILLWASLVLLRAPGSSVNLAAFIQSPGDQNGWISIIMFLFAIGFLYLSVKLASMFATTVGGFGFAALAPALAFGIGGRIAAFATRRTVGFAASRAGAWVGARATGATRRMGGVDADGRPLPGGKDTRLRTRLEQRMYAFGEKQLKGVATRDMNVAHTMLGREIQKVAQFKKPETFTGPDSKGYEGIERRAAEQYARRGEAAALSKEQQGTLIQGVREAILQGNRQLADTHRETEDRLRTANQELEHARHAELQLMQKQAKGMQENMARWQSQGLGTDTMEQNKLRLRQDHDRELEAQRSRIVQAQKSVTQEVQNQEGLLKHLDEIAKREGKLPAEFKTAAEAAFDLARGRFTNTLREAAGFPLAAQDDTLAKRAAAEIKMRKERKDVSIITDILKKQATESAPVSPNTAPRAPRGGTVT